MGWAEFWPYYLAEHADPRNRRMHVIGTSIAFILIVATIALQAPWFLLAALVSGYLFAWLGHFVFQKNRPATFTYPIKSLVYDWRMWALAITGRLSKELARHGIQDVKGPQRGAGNTA